MIAAHGSGMVNAIFLPDHACVLEIFPNRVFMDAYQRMCTLSGLIYFPLYSNMASPLMTWAHKRGDKDDAAIRLV
jgi:capsular polysaccharide biosynthesis protein